MSKKLSAIASAVFTGLLAAGAGVPANANDTAIGPQMPGSDEARTYVTASIASAHFGKAAEGEDYNNFNPGIGFERVSGFNSDSGGLRLGVKAGIFNNSIGRISGYVAGEAELCSSPRKTFMLCAGGMLGAVTGYRSLPVAPAFVPYAKLEHNPSGAFGRVMIIPPIGNAIPGTVGLEVGLGF